MLTAVIIVVISAEIIIAFQDGVDGGVEGLLELFLLLVLVSGPAAVEERVRVGEASAVVVADEDVAAPGLVGERVSEVLEREIFGPSREQELLEPEVLVVRVEEDALEESAERGNALAVVGGSDVVSLGVSAGLVPR